MNLIFLEVLDVLYCDLELKDTKAHQCVEKCNIVQHFWISDSVLTLNLLKIKLKF